MSKTWKRCGPGWKNLNANAMWCDKQMYTDLSAFINHNIFHRNTKPMFNENFDKEGIRN